MEQAQLFAHLGAQVTLVGHLAPRAEPELRAVMAGVLAEDRITVIEERAARVTATDSGVTTVTRSGRKVTAARVLVATGRRPVTDGLNLQAAGAQLDDRGFVIIDTHQQTSNPRVYAAGDVAGTPQSVYVAAASGRVGSRQVTPSTRRARLRWWTTPGCPRSCSRARSWLRSA